MADRNSTAVIGTANETLRFTAELSDNRIKQSAAEF